MEEQDAVCFGVKPSGMDVYSEQRTKADAVDDLMSFYTTATHGTAGAEEGADWRNIVFSYTGTESLSDRTFTSEGVYWPFSDPHLHVYASNMQMDAFSVSGMTVTTLNANNDLICAYDPYVDIETSYKVKRNLVFKHPYARVSGVTVTSKQGAGYDISNVDIWIENVKTGGVYNLRTGSEDAAILSGAGWSSRTPSDETWSNADPLQAGTSIYSHAGVISSGNSDSNTNIDLWLVPGDYWLRCSWRAAQDDYMQDFSCIRSASAIHLSGGKMNVISVVLTGNGVEVSFGVTLAEWGSNLIDDGFVPYDFPLE